MRSIKKYLYDIARAIEQMREHTDGVTLEEYLREFALRAVAEQSLTIMCESLTQIGHQDPTVAGQITGYRRWVRMRTSLVSFYWNIDDEIVWDTVQQDIPILEEEVRKLLADSSIE